MRVEYWFDVSCPFAYLGSTQIEALAARAGAELAWRPMLLGGVFRAVGNPEAGLAPGRVRYSVLDAMRWADVLGVPLRYPAGHPNRTVRALRALLALPEPAWPPVIHALYAAYWVQGADVSRVETVAAALAGVAAADRERALAADGDPAIKDDLRRRTDEAVARGVFGAPTIFVTARAGDDPLMFWGQDRLAMVERALAGWRPAPPVPGCSENEQPRLSGPRSARSSFEGSATRAPAAPSSPRAPHREKPGS